MNKCLAQTNKSRTSADATKTRIPPMLRFGVTEGTVRITDADTIVIPEGTEAWLNLK